MARPGPGAAGTAAGGMLQSGHGGGAGGTGTPTHPSFASPSPRRVPSGVSPPGQGRRWRQVALATAGSAPPPPPSALAPASLPRIPASPPPPPSPPRPAARRGDAGRDPRLADGSPPSLAGEEHPAVPGPQNLGTGRRRGEDQPEPGPETGYAPKISPQIQAYIEFRGAMSKKGQRLHLFGAVFCLFVGGFLSNSWVCFGFGFGFFFGERDQGHLCAKKSQAAAQLSDSPALGKGGPLLVVCGAGGFLMVQP